MDLHSYDSGSRHGYERKSRRSSRSRYNGVSNASSLSDEYEYKGSRVTSPNRRMNRSVVRCQTPPPLVKRIVERVPTPEPEILERVIIRPAPQTIVERIIERPKTPPPQIVNREVTESPQPTIVRTRVVKVDSRGDCNSRGYPSDGRYSRYDRYWEDDPCMNRGRSVRSRRNSHYSRSTSRSSSRHSSYHPRYQMSRSGSFEVIRIPGRTPYPAMQPDMYGYNQPEQGNSRYFTEGYQNVIRPAMTQPPMYGHTNAMHIPTTQIPGMPYGMQQTTPMSHHNSLPYCAHNGVYPGMQQPSQVINLPSVHLTPAQMPYLFQQQMYPSY